MNRRVATALRSFVSSHKRTASAVQQLLDRFTPLQDAVFAVFGGDPRRRYESWIAAYDTLDEADLAAMGKLSDGPFFSVLGPTELSEALRSQAYDRWTPVVGDTLDLALRSAETEFVVLVDANVSVRSHALFMLAAEIVRHRDAVLVYGDDDVIDATGARSDHYFKPDWNEPLFRSQNYLGGLVAFRRSLALDVGGFEDELDGDDAWDLFLRMSAAAPPETIHHVPFVLSHWVGERPRKRAPGRGEPVGAESYRVAYPPPDPAPGVSIVVPSTCELEVLRPCLDGVLNRTSYADLELLLVVSSNRALDAKQRAFLDDIESRSRVRVLSHDERPFNFATVNNRAARQAQGELLCFLNDDTEVIAPEWLAAMVARISRARVAAVGALLLYPNGRIQHAGIVIGAGVVAAHTYWRRRRDIRGYHDRALVDQDVSAVTAACMLIRRDVFVEVGGFDESLPIAFNDIDLCLRVRESGRRIVWTPSAVLYHKESASIGPHYAGDREAEWRAAAETMESRWGDKLRFDPYYNPNLSLDPLQLWEPAFPPRVSYPWHVGARAAH